ncbi:pilus assembly protein PilM [Desulfitobacterium hafniense]|uniref:Pilus assembly protein PilM n=1 Tax=Desulfitobacterium hafniense TaxID=49338 RepID=A0A0W1JE70_DESHA|nr:pilus assembly protein PilM [Desulfitobacterium hafniense]
MNENRWVVAKVSRKKNNLVIYHLAELNRAELIPEEERAAPNRQYEHLAAATEKMPVDWHSPALKSWLRKNKVSVKKLGITLSCPGVITRMVTLPQMSNKDLEKLLSEQVDQYFTLNISDYVVDYRILEKVQEEDQVRLRVLLVAVPLDEWEKQWKLWESIGFAPKVADFSADCLCRLYHRLGGWGGSKNQVPILDLAIVDLGTDRVEFILMEHGVFFLYSDMEISLGELNDQKVLNESSLIEELNETRKPPEPIELNESIEPMDSVEVAYPNELEDRLLPVFNTLSEFLNFFASRHYGKSVDQIFITGECANYENLEELFERNMGIQSKVGFPEDWKPKFKKKYRNYAEHWMKYGSLYGLAIRED